MIKDHQLPPNIKLILSSPGRNTGNKQHNLIGGTLEISLYRDGDMKILKLARKPELTGLLLVTYIYFYR